MLTRNAFKSFALPQLIQIQSPPMWLYISVSIYIHNFLIFNLLTKLEQHNSLVFSPSYWDYYLGIVRVFLSFSFSGNLQLHIENPIQKKERKRSSRGENKGVKMGFLTLFQVALMPVLEVLLISGLGAFMATKYCNILPADARNSLNKIVFVIFTPSLIFASLAKTVTLQDIISWWFMPINVGLTFLIGGILGWITVKLLKPGLHLEGLVIACSSAANLGNLLLIAVPAICHENGSPFGDHGVCTSVGLSYSSFSMALGGLFVWTYTYHLVRGSAVKCEALQAVEEGIAITEPNKDIEAHEQTHLLTRETPEHDYSENQAKIQPFWKNLKGVLHQIVKELLAPPTIAAILGFIFGAIFWLKQLIIGENAPFHVIQDSLKLLGDGNIPCITLILGGNLIQGLRSSKVKLSVILGVLCVRFLLLPVIGIGVVKIASNFGFLAPDPLYQFVLMLQFTLPPAMYIGTMTQLFGVGQEECSVIFLWTYAFAAPALACWSTVFMWILS